MLTTPDLAPLDEEITFDQLHLDPYPIYRRLRAEAPVLRVRSIGRTFLTRAADTKFVKDNPALFSSDDPNTPMKPAFQAHTLMRKDGPDHLSERMAMAPALMPGTIHKVWQPLYRELAEAYLDRLPKDGIVDFHTEISGPIAARMIVRSNVTTVSAFSSQTMFVRVMPVGAGAGFW